MTAPYSVPGPVLEPRRERALRRLIGMHFGPMADGAIRAAETAVRARRPEWTALQVQHGALLYLGSREGLDLS